MSAENISKFVSHLSESIANDTFVKMTLGNYRGNDSLLQKLLIRLIDTKKGSRLFFLYKYETRDTAKNFDHEEGLKLIESFLGNDFFAGHLFTTKNNLQLDIGKKGKSRLNFAKPTFANKPDLDHDKAKTRIVDPNSPFLKALGISSDFGEVHAKQQKHTYLIRAKAENLHLKGLMAMWYQVSMV